MVPLFLASCAQDGANAKQLLDQVTEVYRNAAHFEAVVHTSSVKGRSAEPGDTEAYTFRVQRDGDRYQVTPQSEPADTWSGTAETAGQDPHLAYTHEVTRWLGFRATRLTERLVPTDAVGPFYSLDKRKDGLRSVRESYVSPRFGTFAITTLVAPAPLSVVSVHVMGVIEPVSEDSRHSPPPVMLFQTTTLDNQRFGPAASSARL